MANTSVCLLHDIDGDPKLSKLLIKRLESYDIRTALTRDNSYQLDIDGSASTQPHSSQVAKTTSSATSVWARGLDDECPAHRGYMVDISNDAVNRRAYCA